MQLSARYAGVLLALCAGLSCGESAVVAPAKPPAPEIPRVAVAGVRVVVDSTQLGVGATTTAQAIALDTRSDELPGRPVVWSVDAPSVLTVSSTGVVTALASGSAHLIATVEGVRGDAALTVIPRLAAKVAVAVDAERVVVGGSVQARASALDPAGRALVDRPVRWSVADHPNVASVSSTGLITALAAGTARIHATVDSATGSVNIAVVPLGGALQSVAVRLDAPQLIVGAVQQARATVNDSVGNPIAGYPVQWSIAGAAGIASVDARGQVTAIATGDVQVRATAGSITGQAPLSVVAVPQDNVTLPELPRVHLNTSYAPATGRTIVVRAGDNLQAALNGARRGDELVLDAGATFRGNFVLPKLPGTAADGWVIVRSSQLAAMPEGKRVTPAQAALMPRLETPDAGPAVATAIGASGWRLAGLELTVDSTFAAQQNGLILFGDGTSAQSTLADVASDLTLDRSYVHGRTTSQVKRCVALNSARSAVIDSYVADCHLSGFDSQAILGWNGPGPFKIENNTLMGASENIMFGGADPAIANLVPADIEIRRNFLYTPPSWRGVWQKKNLFELKSAERVLFESNVLDGSWVDGQTGYAMQLKIENQSGRCTWCRTFDVTIRGNVIQHVGGAFNLAGVEGGSPYPATERLTRVLIEQNVVHDVNVSPFDGDARLFLVQNDVRDLTIRNNTITSAGSLNSFLYLGRGTASRRFLFARNIVTDGRYGFFADALGEGLVALAALGESVAISGNAVIGRARLLYPTGVQFVGDLTAARGVRGAGADEAWVAQNTANVVVP